MILMQDCNFSCSVRIPQLGVNFQDSSREVRVDVRGSMGILKVLGVDLFQA